MLSLLQLYQEGKLEEAINLANTFVIDIETFQAFDDPELAHLSREEQVDHMEIGLLGIGGWTGDGASYTLAFSNTEDFPSIWSHLCGARHVVSWSGTIFDLRILHNTLRKMAETNDKAHEVLIFEPVNFDLQRIIEQGTQRRYSLDSVSRATLGEGKENGRGAMVPQMLRQHRDHGNELAFIDAQIYNARDLELTGKLYRHAVESKKALILPAKDKPGYESSLQLWIDEHGQSSFEPF